MRINACPKCGRQPKIEEWWTINGVRRRGCHCPNFCSVVPSSKSHLDTYGFGYLGEGDDNAIYKLWNLATDKYSASIRVPWYKRDWSPWSNDVHLDI